MNKELQIATLKRMFKAYNPDEGTDAVDWEGEVDSTLNLTENTANLERHFPQFDFG